MTSDPWATATVTDEMFADEPCDHREVAFESRGTIHRSGHFTAYGHCACGRVIATWGDSVL